MLHVGMGYGFEDQCTPWTLVYAACGLNLMIIGLLDTSTIGKEEYDYALGLISRTSTNTRNYWGMIE